MTSQPEIPTDLQEFLRERISSYEQLEVLLLLRSHPTKRWGTQSVTMELRIKESLAEEALRSLCKNNLLRVDVGSGELLFTYRPHPPELDEVIGTLAKAYRDERLEVMKLMTAHAVERLRTSVLRKFSDSFILRKNKDGDG